MGIFDETSGRGMRSPVSQHPLVIPKVFHQVEVMTLCSTNSLQTTLSKNCALFICSQSCWNRKGQPIKCFLKHGSIKLSSFNWGAKANYLKTSPSHQLACRHMKFRSLKRSTLQKVSHLFAQYSWPLWLFVAYQLIVALLLFPFCYWALITTYCEMESNKEISWLDFLYRWHPVTCTMVEIRASNSNHFG